MNWKQKNHLADYNANLENIKWCEKRLTHAEEGTTVHRTAEIELFIRECIKERHEEEAAAMGLEL